MINALNKGNLSFAKYRRFVTYFMTFSLLSLLFLGIYFDNNKILILTVLISASLIMWETWIGILFLFVASSIYYVTLFPGVSLYRAFALITLFSFLFKVFNTRKICLKRQALFWSLLIVLISLLSVLFSIFPEASIVEFLSLFVNVVVFIIIISIPSDLNYSDFELFLFASLGLILFLGITMYTKGLYIDVSRLSISEEVNPNMFAIGISQMLPFLMSFYFLTKNKDIFRKLIIVLGIFAGGVLLVFSGSRSSILGAAAGINFVLYLFNKNNRLKKWVTIISLDSLLVLSIWKIQFYIPSLSRRFMIENILGSKFTRREIIWLYLFKDVIPNHIWLGVGVGGASVSKALALAGVPQIYQLPAHNILIDILAQLGVFGLTIFSIFYAITLWKGAKNLYRYSFIIPFYSIFITSLVIGVGETVYFNKLFWISIGMIWRESFRHKEKQFIIKGGS